MTWTTRPRSEIAAGICAWTCGSGDPLLLLHGVGLNADAWGAQADVLGARYSVYAVDMPGHGDSIALPGHPGLKDYTDRIAAVLNAIKTPALVAGHSMGAMMALDLAIRYPRAVRGVAALNAIFRREPGAANAVQARAASLPTDRAADPAAPLQRWFGADLDSDAASACREWLATVDPVAYKQAYTVFANEDGPGDAGLSNLRCPALFLTGADEPNSTPAMSQAMAAIAPCGEAIVIDGAAHMMPMTHASEVNTALLDFFGQNTEEPA